MRLRPLRRILEAQLTRLIQPEGTSAEDFLRPLHEPALMAADSISWIVYKNPLTLFIGGIAAVVLELAEPRVRSGVWDHTAFRSKPLDRLRRTAYAAMLTVYGPRSVAEAMIAGVARLHARVSGVTPDGRPYCANDPELLGWVQATASFGFLTAYETYVRPLDALQRDRFYAEGARASRLYGAVSTPTSQAETAALFACTLHQLERSAIVFEFLHIMQRAPVLPALLRPVQSVLVKAAVRTVPANVRSRLGLLQGWDLSPGQHRMVGHASRACDRLVLLNSPAVLACRRLGLPDDQLFAAPSRAASHGP